MWKVSLGGSGRNEIKEDCFENNRIRIGWDSYGEDLTEGTEEPSLMIKDIINDFSNVMDIGDIVFSLDDEKHIASKGVFCRLSSD
ncbi:hypothetical protein [Lysinibacillus sp. NPDC047702]|uniref:hypothetical protein n=1 Tax=unclassified Lysinibacillus TaxID=2636778 RepID=UPI003D0707B9